MLATVLRRLSQEKGRWQRVALESGVPYQTITKIACGFVLNPRILTVQPLFDYFELRPEHHAPGAIAPVALQVSPDDTNAVGR